MSDTIPEGYCQCGCGQKTPLAKRTDPRFGHIKGQPTKYLVGHGLYRDTPKEVYDKRFWAKIAIAGENECWLWRAGKSKRGYGVFSPGKYVFAHRYMYELINGPITSDMCVCHTCDNPGCVNPAHLFLATSPQNTADKVAKNRQARGRALNLGQFTDNEVREIRHLYAAADAIYKMIRDKYGIGIPTARFIAERKSYGYVRD